MQQPNDEQAARLRAAMLSTFPEAMVTNYESLIATMPNDEKDRHVTAATVKAGAQVIVTNNLIDFHPLPEGIEAQCADEFLSDLFDRHPVGMVDVVLQQARALRSPPRSVDDILRALGKIVPAFAQSVSTHLRHQCIE